MKKLIILSLLLFSTKIGYGGNEALVKECQTLIYKAFHNPEYNPLHQPITDSIQRKFQRIFNDRDIRDLSSTYSKDIEQALRDIYDNGYGEYEDSPDIRRMKMRRASCFASIALLSDYNKAYAFLDYAIFSISESNGKPELELENQYLGLLLLEIMFLLEEDYLSEGYLAKLEAYLSEYRNSIMDDVFIKTSALIAKCRAVAK